MSSRRSTRCAPVLAQLIRGRGTARLDLAPFGPEEHAAHVAQLLGSSPPPALLRATYARSEGNPFYTEELLAAGDPDAARLPNPCATPCWYGSGSCRQTRWKWSAPLALAGPSRISCSHAVAALDEACLLAALRETVDRAVVVPDPETGRYGFRHPLIAEAVYADLMPAERSRLHRAFAEALAADPDLGDASPARAAAELANHWYAAGVMRRPCRPSWPRRTRLAAFTPRERRWRTWCAPRSSQIGSGMRARS